MTGIITAMDSEAASILELAVIQRQFTLAGKKCYIGTVETFPICLAVCGIGKVNAASAAQALISNFPQIRRIINIGVAGAVSPRLKLCEVCVAERCVQYDFDVTAIDNVPVGYIQNLDTQYLSSDKDMLSGLGSLFSSRVTVATADRFSHSKTDRDFIISLGADLRDMELGAIYQVCALNNIPVISIKSVSDTAEGNPAEEFAQNLSKATRCYQPYIIPILRAVT